MEQNLKKKVKKTKRKKMSTSKMTPKMAKIINEYESYLDHQEKNTVIFKWDIELN
jgi:hypothetical protein